MGARNSKQRSAECDFHSRAVKDTSAAVRTELSPVHVSDKCSSGGPVLTGAATGDKGADRTITFLHFNDVYNIDAGNAEPVGGAARFTYMVNSLKGDNPLVVFSGDAFNPSILSTITLGEQMPKVLNHMNIQVACIGNHDFDFGTAQLKKLVKQCNFPWLMANVLDRQTRKPYADALATYMLEWHGVKVGFVGLVEEEWMETLGAVNPEDVEYISFIEEGRRLAKQLMAEGAELLVAVTHMREPNDRKLAAEVPEFHIVMGGHDHHYITDFVEPHNVLMVKSGTDFRDMTRVDVVMPASGGKPSMSWTRISIDSSVPEDPEVAKIVDGYMGDMNKRLAQVIGYCKTDLDGRFSTVRTQESNLGDFFCDVQRRAAGCDIVVMNGGSYRSDAVHPAGPFTLDNLMSILPMLEDTVVLGMTGSQVLQVLENGVSMYPRSEGRFPQVSGIRFVFDPTAPEGQRIVLGSVYVGGRPLQLDRQYSVCTKTYMASGHDGYDVFKECPILVDEETSPLPQTAVRNHFLCLRVLTRMDPKVRMKRVTGKWKRHTSASKIAAERQSGDGAVPPDCKAQPEMEAVHEGGTESGVPKDGTSDPADANAEQNPNGDSALGEEGAEGSAQEDALDFLDFKGPLEAQLPSRTFHDLDRSDMWLCVLEEEGYCISPETDGRIAMQEQAVL